MTRSTPRRHRGVCRCVTVHHACLVLVGSRDLLWLPGLLDPLATGPNPTRCPPFQAPLLGVRLSERRRKALDDPVDRLGPTWLVGCVVPVLWLAAETKRRSADEHVGREPTDGSVAGAEALRSA